MGIVGDDFAVSTLLPEKIVSQFGQNVIQPDGSVASNGIFNQALAGAGFTPQNGWTISYGLGTLPGSGTLKTNIYEPWIGTPPTNPGLDGKSRQIAPPAGSSWPQEVAGATIQIEAILPKVPNLHFIQMYTEGFNSNNPPTVKLDNPSPNSPFYDQGAVAFTNVNMTDGNFGSWFQDTPDKFETEALDPYWNIPLTWTETFEEALVTTSPGPNNTTVLTIYGGVEWGFKANFLDLTTPEPSTLALAGIACAIGAGYRWRRRTAKATA